MNHSKISTRFFASLVDSIIITAVNTAIQVACVKLIPSLGILLAPLLSLLFFYFYIFQSIQKTGQTLGKKLLGIQIVFESVEPSAWTIIKREIFGKLLSSIFFIGYIWAFFDQNKQGWHDKLAKTEVITLEGEEEQSSATPWLKWLPLIGLPALSLTITFIFLFTSAPLSALHTKMESAGLKMDSISGSIIGGIEIKNFAGDFDQTSFQFKTITFKIDFLESILNKKFLVSHATAENGFLDRKSLELGIPTLNKQNAEQEKNPVNQKNDKNPNSLPLGIGLLRLKEVTFKANKETILALHLLEVKSLELSQKKISFDQIQFSTDKINLSLEEALIEPEKNKFALNRINGYLTPALSKILKKKLDFALQTQSPQGAKIKVTGTIAGAKVVGIWGDENKLLEIKDLNISEYLTADLPIENFNLKLSLEDKKIPSYESTFSICKKEFQLQGASFIHSKNGKIFYVRPAAPPTPTPLAAAPATPSPSGSAPDTAGPVGLAYDENKSASDYLPLALTPGNGNGPYSSTTEVVSDLCYGKKTEQLFPDELTIVNSMTKAVTLPESAIQPQLTNASTSPEEMVKTFQLKFDESKNLFRQGKQQEALNILQNVSPPATLSKDQQIAFLRHISWLNLLYGDSKKSAVLFELLYNETQNISDAEGALRSFEKNQDQQNKGKWAGLIKAKIASNPELKEKLSGNFRRSIASEN